MFEALAIGATGMQAQQVHVETIANNLANLQTAGFKKGRVVFSELVAPSLRGELDPSSAGAAIGAGVGWPTAVRVFEAGELRQTGSAWDVALRGEGFLEVILADGGRGFVRGGTFRVNADGLLATAGGLQLKPGISIPADAESFTVGANGRVQLRLPGQSHPVEAGQLELVRFSHPAGLLAQGEGVFRPTEASGEPVTGKAGEDGLATLAQGFVEASNVKLVDEMVGLMVAQRAYEASVKVVQAADEMLGMVNGLRR